MPVDPKKKKYDAFKKTDKGGRGHVGSVGFDKKENYAAGVGPRVGGTVQKGVVASGTSNKKLIKKSMKNVSRSSASPQAKRSARKLYK